MSNANDWSGFQPEPATPSQEERAFGLRSSDYPTDARLRAPEHQQPNPASMPPVKVSRDKAQYVRQQKGHSWILHWLVLGIFTLWALPIYYTVSPNHYWHV